MLLNQIQILVCVELASFLTECTSCALTGLSNAMNKRLDKISFHKHFNLIDLATRQKGMHGIPGFVFSFGGLFVSDLLELGFVFGDDTLSVFSLARGLSVFDVFLPDFSAAQFASSFKVSETILSMFLSSSSAS